MSLTDSALGIFSAWVNIGTTKDAWLASFYTNNLATSIFEIIIDANGNLTVRKSNLTMQFNSEGLSLIGGAGWFHLLASWDMTGPDLIAHLYINDVLDINLTNPFTPGVVPWSSITNVAFLTLAANTSFTFKYVGCITQLYLNTREYLDFSLTGNRRKFISSTGGLVYLGANGELPTGTSPSYYFYGNVADFRVNRGVDGTATAVGTFLDCLDSPQGS